MEFINNLEKFPPDIIRDKLTHDKVGYIYYRKYSLNLNNKLGLSSAKLSTAEANFSLAWI